MLLLMPPALHRTAYRVAHWLRIRWWRVSRPTLEGTAVIATDLADQLLLIRLSYGSGGWNLPAGGIAKGEDPEKAAHRELFEETGCEAGRLSLIGVQEEKLFGATNRVHVFTATVSGLPRPDGREVIDARFFPMHSLPEPLTGATRRRLELHRSILQQG